MNNVERLTPDGVREWRACRGLTQARLAAILDVDVMTVSSWECGHNRWKGYMLEYALKGLEATMDESRERGYVTVGA